jgi:hypothetical protein
VTSLPTHSDKEPCPILVTARVPSSRGLASQEKDKIILTSCGTPLDKSVELVLAR